MLYIWLYWHNTVAKIHVVIARFIIIRIAQYLNNIIYHVVLHSCCHGVFYKVIASTDVSCSSKSATSRSSNSETVIILFISLSWLIEWPTGKIMYLPLHYQHCMFLDWAIVSYYCPCTRGDGPVTKYYTLDAGGPPTSNQCF